MGVSVITMGAMVLAKDVIVVSRAAVAMDDIYMCVCVCVYNVNSSLLIVIHPISDNICSSPG